MKKGKTWVGLREQCLPSPPVAQRQFEVPGTLWPWADVQGMRGRDLGHYLASLIWNGFYTPVKTESRAQHCLLLLPATLGCQPSPERDAALPSKTPFSDWHS